MKNICFFIAALTWTSSRWVVNAGEAEFLQLQAKVEQDVLQFRDRVENVYRTRCEAVLSEACNGGSYHGCLSTFPNPTCPPPGDFQFDACTGDMGCSSLVDYSTSSIRFPPNTEVTSLDWDLVTSTCFSQQLDDYFIQKDAEDKEYWAQWGVESPWMHFSSNTGMFRIYPARPDDRCFTYDPRRRPFYVAASSGPKNLLLLVDTSGSMEGERLDYLKQAAERIVDTLTIGDRVAFIPFSGSAQPLRVENSLLMRATSDTKEILKRQIRNLRANGSTNFLGAFQTAFQIMEEAIPQELFVNCNTAIVFLTDGENTDSTDSEVLEAVQRRINEIEAMIDHPIHLFTYSVSDTGNVHELPKSLACTTTPNGVWSKILEAEQIVDSLSSYQKLFALGLGEGNNRNFTAWVEPYEFFNAKLTGTTVSAPVFDRSVDPPVLIGVVGIDFPMSALDRALGVPIGSTATFDRVVRSSTVQCPRLRVSSCQLESFRAIGPAGSEAQCTTDCNQTDLLLLEEEQCDLIEPSDNGPTDAIIANLDTRGLSFGERACCFVNSTTPTDQCFSGSGTDSTSLSCSVNLWTAIVATAASMVVLTI